LFLHWHLDRTSQDSNGHYCSQDPDLTTHPQVWATDCATGTWERSESQELSQGFARWPQRGDLSPVVYSMQKLKTVADDG